MSKRNSTPPTHATKPLVLVFIEGGNVSDILTDSPVDVRVIDYDNAGTIDECDTFEIPMIGEKPEMASVADWTPTPTIRRVHQVWRAVDRQVAKMKDAA